MDPWFTRKQPKTFATERMQVCCELFVEGHASVTWWQYVKLSELHKYWTDSISCYGILWPSLVVFVKDDFCVLHLPVFARTLVHDIWYLQISGNTKSELNWCNWGTDPHALPWLKVPEQGCSDAWLKASRSLAALKSATHIVKSQHF